MPNKTKVPAQTVGGWTFLTNHSHVLLCLAAEPDLRLRDVAERVMITERAVQRIVADLEAAGILNRSREGRRNQYQVNGASRLRHPVEAHCTIIDLLKMVNREEGSVSPRKSGQGKLR